MLTEAEPEWLTEEVKTGVSPPTNSSRLRLIYCAVLHFRHTVLLMVADHYPRHRVRRRCRSGIRLPSLRGVSQCTRMQYTSHRTYVNRFICVFYTVQIYKV